MEGGGAGGHEGEQGGEVGEVGVPEVVGGELIEGLRAVAGHGGEGAGEEEVRAGTWEEGGEGTHDEGGAGEEGPLVLVGVAVLCEVEIVERVPAQERLRPWRGRDEARGGVEEGQQPGRGLEQEEGGAAGEERAGEQPSAAVVVGHGTPVTGSSLRSAVGA